MTTIPRGPDGSPASLAPDVSLDAELAPDTELASSAEFAPDTELASSAEFASAAELERLTAVLQGVADGITVQGPDGSLIFANAAAAELCGFESVEAFLAAGAAEIVSRFELYDQSGRPISPAELPGRHALRGEHPPTTTIRFRVRATGVERWTRVTATPTRDPVSGAWLAVNAFHEITAEKQAEMELRASELRYRHLTDALPQVAWVTDEAGRLAQASARWAQETGSPPALGRSIVEAIGSHPDDLDGLAAAWREALETGEPLERTVRIRDRNGHDRWHLIRAVALLDGDGTRTGWIGTSTDVDASIRAEGRAQLLADAARQLDESLDLETMVETGTGLAVPHLADWCSIDLVEPDGTVERVSVVCADPARREIADRLRAHPIILGSERPSARAIAERRPVVWADLDEAVLAPVRERFPEVVDLYLQLRTTSAIAVPLIARGEILGALFLAASDGSRRYGEADVELAVDLASRVALGISNARLYAGEQQARAAAEAAAARTDRLQSVTAALSSARTTSEVAEIVLDRGILAAGATAARILLLDPDGSGLELLASRGYPDGDLRGEGRIPIDRDAEIVRALAAGRVDWELGRPTDGAGRDGGSAPATNGEGPATIRAAIPIVVRDRPVGIVELADRDRNGTAAEDRDLVVSIVELFGQALERVRLEETRERLLRDLDAQRARLEAVLRQMPSGILLVEAPGGRVLLGNEAADRIWRGRIVDELRAGIGLDDALARPDGSALALEEWPFVRSIELGEVVEDEELAFRRLDGSLGRLVASSTPIRDRGGRIVAGVMIFDDVTDQRVRDEQERFLAEATRLLASSLDYQETIGHVANLAVPRVADWCSIDLLDANGRLQPIALVHADPGKLEFAREYRRRHPPDPDADRGAYAVIRSRHSVLVSEVTADMLRNADLGDEERRMVDELDIGSYMAVPLEIGGEIAGVITFVNGRSAHRFDADTVMFAEALAARAAAAIQNARLFRDAARFRRILDATWDAITVFDPETLRVTDISEGAARQLARPREALIGGSPLDHADGMTESELREQVRLLVSGEAASRTINLVRRRPDGSAIPVEILLQYIALPDEPGQVVAIARDISERVATQRHLEELALAEHSRAAELNAIILAMGEGVVVCDAAGRITLANPAARDVFPEIERWTYDEVVARLEDPEGLAPSLGRHGGPVELRVRGQRERWLELTTYPVDPDGGRARETIILLRDVTAARQRQVVRDTFVGILSHELRTPVTTIYAGAKVLGRPGVAEEVRREIFEDIQAEAERLHRLVEDVIALTRFEEGSVDVGHEPVLLQRILPTVAKSEQGRWPGTLVRLELPADLPPVAADPTYVEQVVRNLLSNAAKYGGPGAAIEVRAETRPSGDVVVRILDEGPGFPEDEADRLFELFYRSAATSASAAGAGIGLFVCARLIAAMNGRIWAAPRPSGGAEFGFALKVMDEGG